MFDFLKICGMGLLYTLLSPLFAVVFVLYLLYATIMLFYNLGRGILLFFKGVNITKQLLPEEILAKKILEDRKAALQNQFGQAPYVNPNPQPVNQMPVNSQPVNPNMYGQPNQPPYQQGPVNPQYYQGPVDNNMYNNPPINRNEGDDND